MYSRILVPIDGSKLSDKAVREAAQLAKLTGAALLLLHVRAVYDASISAESAPLGSIGKRKIEQDVRAAGQLVLDAAAKIAAGRGIEAKTLMVISPSPYEAIVKSAKKEKIDLIVMASHGRRGLAAVLIGSETQKVLTHTSVPVLVVR